MFGFNSFLSRTTNKARAGFLHLYQDTLDTIDTNIAQPALEARNSVVDTLKTAGGAAVDVAKNYKMILIVVGLVALAYLAGPFIRSIGEK